MLAEPEMVRNIGQLLGLPLLHVENHKWWWSVAESPLRELPQTITPANQEENGGGEEEEEVTIIRKLQDLSYLT